MRLATIQRHVRTQSISGKGFTPHFKIGCMVTSGPDEGNFGFEKEALTEHILAMKEIFRGYYKVDQLSFRLVCRGGYADSIKLASRLNDLFNNIILKLPSKSWKHPKRKSDIIKASSIKRI